MPLGCAFGLVIDFVEDMAGIRASPRILALAPTASFQRKSPADAQWPMHSGRCTVAIASG